MAADPARGEDGEAVRAQAGLRAPASPGSGDLSAPRFSGVAPGSWLEKALADARIEIASWPEWLRASLSPARHAPSGPPESTSPSGGESCASPPPRGWVHEGGTLWGAARAIRRIERLEPPGTCVEAGAVFSASPGSGDGEIGGLLDALVEEVTDDVRAYGHVAEPEVARPRVEEYVAGLREERDRLREACDQYVSDAKRDCDAARAEVERLRKRLESALDAWDRHRTGFPLGYEVAQAIFEAGRAALAASVGGPGDGGEDTNSAATKEGDS